MGIDEILKSRREEILAFAAHCGAHNVRGFGSVARGEATTESDVDFLVEMDGTRSYFDLVRLLDGLEALLGRRVDIITDDGLSPYLRSRILSEATPV
jgi:predicted nucleotidyltransferase